MARSIERRRAAVPNWQAAAAGVIAGLLIGVVTEAISNSRIELLGLPLYGNGALVLVALGIALVIYAGWVWLGGLVEGRELAIRMAAFGTALVIGAFPLGLFFGVPALLVGGGTYALFATGRLPRVAGMFWLVFAVGLVVSALPTVAILGLGVMPAVASFALRHDRTATQAAAGAGLAAALLLVLLIAPVSVYPLFGLPSPGRP